MPASWSCHVPLCARQRLAPGPSPDPQRSFRCGTASHRLTLLLITYLLTSTRATLLCVAAGADAYTEERIHLFLGAALQPRTRNRAPPDRRRSARSPRTSGPRAHRGGALAAAYPHAVGAQPTTAHGSPRYGVVISPRLARRAATIEAASSRDIRQPYSRRRRSWRPSGRQPRASPCALSALAERLGSDRLRPATDAVRRLRRAAHTGVHRGAGPNADFRARTLGGAARADLACGCVASVEVRRLILDFRKKKRKEKRRSAPSSRRAISTARWPSRARLLLRPRAWLTDPDIPRRPRRTAASTCARRGSLFSRAPGRGRWGLPATSRPPRCCGRPTLLGARSPVARPGHHDTSPSETNDFPIQTLAAGRAPARTPTAPDGGARGHEQHLNNAVEALEREFPVRVVE